jgi:glycosyltransferase involved in cell wall biosynthesis
MCVDIDKTSSKAPLITVIVATKNRADTLQRCIDSFKGQTYQNKQLIIIDGGSDDETVNLLTANNQHIDYWESTTDRGIAHAWNKALKLAKGEWILFIGADDWLAHLMVLEDFNEKIKNHRSKERLVYSAIKIFFPSGKYLSTQGTDWLKVRTLFFSEKMMIQHQACFHHYSLFREFGPFDEGFSIASDYEFLLRVLKNEDPLFLPGFIVTHMAFGGISSKPSTLLIMHKEFKNALKKHGFRQKGYKRIFNIFIYYLVYFISRVAGERVAAGLLDMVRIIICKPPVWTRK